MTNETNPVDHIADSGKVVDAGLEALVADIVKLCNLATQKDIPWLDGSTEFSRLQQDVLKRVCDLYAAKAVQPTDEELRDAIAGQLSDLYVCSRVWEAWSVGTMSQDDFSPAAEDEDVLQNIVDGVKSVLAAPAQPVAAQQSKP